MRIVASVIFIISLLASAAAFAQQTAGGGEEKLLVLPLFGYSDEQGLGVGANAAWVNIEGSAWSADTSLFASALYNQTYINLNVANRKLFDILYLQAGGFFDHSSRSLFYGIGNGSDIAKASQYAVTDNYLYGRLGVRVYDDIVVGVGYNHRSTGIDLGSDPTLPQFLAVYLGYPRLSGTTTTSTHVFAAYDDRSPTFAPQSGNFFFTALEQAQPRSGEDLAQQRFVFTAENYFDVLEDKSLILVSRGQYQHEWGEDVPFFLQSSIGGETSLRGFRTNRFVDAASMLINEEPRYSFWTPGGSLFQRFELSLAFELGRVFSYDNIPPFSGYHTDWDVGLTAILEGGVPLRLDYAFSPEGGLIYLHLFYPF